jgi:hypothetical protein
VGLIVLAGTVRPHEETMYDGLKKDFTYIVASARVVLDTLATVNTAGSGFARPRFSFEVGVLPPLYIVGSKYRDPALRRQAIALLARCPVQEGLWDPFGGSEICRWLMGIEVRDIVKDERWEKCGNAADVPEENRVKLTGMLCDLSRRRIWVQCSSRRSYSLALSVGDRIVDDGWVLGGVHRTHGAHEMHGAHGVHGTHGQHEIHGEHGMQGVAMCGIQEEEMEQKKVWETVITW